MAAYPCHRCDQRFEGEAHNVYLTMFEGDEKASFRFVICSGCRDELGEEWVRRALHRTANGDWLLAADDLELGDCFVVPGGGQDSSKIAWRRG